jgi:geranylgeranyl pyrophosphate synthase
MAPESLMETAIEIIDRRGKFSLDEAAQYILKSNDDSIVSEALKYYAKEVFPRVLPIFPALIHLSCEVVGGNPEETKPVATAMMLITASGDIHDDIIDGSNSKFSRKTILGKYGKDITLLAGDTLLVQGMELLQNNLFSLQESKRIVIGNLITKAMFELAAAEAIETALWKKDKVTPKEYFEVIRQKGSIAELHCKIGAFLGDADQESLYNMAEYGRVIGILSTMKDEFMDASNYFEIKNRFNKEILPYPFICAFQDISIKKEILSLIKSKGFSKEEVPFISKTILGSPAVQQVKDELMEMGKNVLAKNSLLMNRKSGKEAVLLLQFLANEL